MNEFPILTPARLREMVGFAAVARHLSFARAAAEVGCTPSVLSRRIASLERTVGGPVFLRSTRQVSLTPLGETLLADYRVLEAALGDLNARLASQHAEPAGLVRLHVPTTYGRRRIAPLLAGFMARYPRIRLDVVFDDGFADLIALRVDVAVRIGRLADSRLVARGLGPVHRVLCASPAYLEQAPGLVRPEDLARHRCLAFTPLQSGALWTLERGRQRRSVRVQPVLATNNADALQAAVLDGAGIALLADFVIGENIASGRLVEVLPQWHLLQPTVQLVWVAGADRAPRVRALIDYLGEHLGGVAVDDAGVRAAQAPA
ncbi:LysR family transcriptional regulator [Marilutibacter alkalisoli]|uniref:LysR family transcriptional regulator n=1 Tax=Marilutibacter alkalisoli TaxID=2591633 RepID=A0A514BUY2_9GAMM|nr:LysR family transcriptional regulator [Lysobacter alkalisoli]QDH71211.1 LysR family transcriptional regulator [Lysobacter alkalisoli]